MMHTFTDVANPSRLVPYKVPGRYVEALVRLRSHCSSNQTIRRNVGYHTHGIYVRTFNNIPQSWELQRKSVV